MKKKNPLTVWTFPYRPLHYITHPWKLVHDIYWNFRNFFHRGRYGYAYVDVWNFCDWYPKVAAEALRYLAAHHSAYPGIDPWTTPKKWEEYLLLLANKLQRCADSQDICFGEERNEYAKEFHKMYNSLERHEEKLSNGCIRTWYDETPEYIELRYKYFAREKELRKVDQEYIEETYKWLAEDLQRLWD